MMKEKSLLKKITGSREALLVVILILLFAVVTALSPSFLTPKSLMEVLKNNSVTIIMALGMLCVMLVGGIDISIMSTAALSGMTIGMLLKYEKISSTLLAFVIAIAIGTLCGALRDARQHGEYVEIHFARIGLPAHGVAARKAHLLRDKRVQFFDLFMVAVKQLHKTCRGARRPLAPQKAEP